MTVYVIKNHSVYDVSKASKFGNIRFILSRFEEVTDGPNVIAQVRDVLSNFDSNRDYLLLIGSPIAISVVSSIAWENVDHGGSIKYLIWDKVDMEYKAVQVTL
jgi:hypothetical protein